MKRYINNWRLFSVFFAAGTIMLSACNKELPEPEPIVTPDPTGVTILEALDDANYSFLKAAVTRASTVNSPTGRLTTLLGDRNTVFTFFAPDDNAFKASLTALGLPADISSLNFIPPGQLDTIIKYHLIGGQEFTSAKVTPSAPNLNLYLQSTFMLSAPSASLPPGYRMPIFIGKQGNFLFANNVPVIQPDFEVANGVIHKVAFAQLPPSTVLWQRIATDPQLTYLAAAIKKADEGDPAKTLESALLNPAANLTVFAPVNTAFQQLLVAQITPAIIPLITQQLIAGGMDPADAAAAAPAMAQAQATALASTPDVFSNPLLATVLTPTVVKGMVVYHILGNRAFSVNMPAGMTSVPTLLNSAIPGHPGVGIQATLGMTGVTSATVKGAANATAANIAINPLPGGSSDQHFINGVLHKLDQVLLPQ